MSVKTSQCISFYGTQALHFRLDVYSFFIAGWIDRTRLCNQESVDGGDARESDVQPSRLASLVFLVTSASRMLSTVRPYILCSVSANPLAQGGCVTFIPNELILEPTLHFMCAIAGTSGKYPGGNEG